MTSSAFTVLPSPLMILASNAVGGERKLEDHLVGLDVDQVLVALDRPRRLSWCHASKVASATDPKAAAP